MINVLQLPGDVVILANTFSVIAAYKVYMAFVSPMITPEKWNHGRKMPEVLEGYRIAVAAFCRLNEMKEKLAAVPFSAKLFSHLDAAHIYVGQVNGKQVLVVECLFGGPMAATVLEEMAYFGITKVIGYGYAGSLTGEIPMGHIVMAGCGLVSDGTSREYLPETDMVFPDESLANVFRRQASDQGCVLKEVTVWTTDALYRETKEKIHQWRAKGGQIVNMDTSYFYAVSQVTGMAALYVCEISDQLDQEHWTDTFGQFKDQVNMMQDLVVKTIAETHLA
jgi:uridine phosphorylase